MYRAADPAWAVRLASAHPKSKCVGLYARINKLNLKGAIERRRSRELSW